MDITLTEFPLYLMDVDGNRSFMTIEKAGVAHDDMWVDAKIGGLVLEQDFSVRDITPEEERKIQEIADNYSASK